MTRTFSTLLDPLCNCYTNFTNTLHYHYHHNMIMLIISKPQLLACFQPFFSKIQFTVLFHTAMHSSKTVLHSYEFFVQHMYVTVYKCTIHLFHFLSYFLNLDMVTFTFTQVGRRDLMMMMRG